MHSLERDIILDIPREQLWDFMATPANLNALTPPELNFRIVSTVPEKMSNGLLIEYLIRIPLFGSWRWLTEIKHIREGEYFVDEQRIGPYRLWYHEHLLETLEDGRTRMRDKVTYRLPFGPLGELIHELQVKKMLDNIFSYRAKRLRELFP
ncbi:MAG: hypothetical protein C0622_11210 [Desulfuromonas sp.]|nr:MAG: hypothetical protein C0622_11210 [Desulfuromonas sp.]